MSWFVYIVECKDGSLYTGITTNLKRRVKEHNSGKGAKAIVKSKRPVKLVYTELCADRSGAVKREMSIKNWKREHKLKLIVGRG